MTKWIDKIISPFLLKSKIIIKQQSTTKWGSQTFPSRSAVFQLNFFHGPLPLIKSTYIKTNTVFGLSKYSCIWIDKNIRGINSLFFYENQKFRPQMGPFALYINISDFYEGVKDNFFCFISKQIPYLVSLNTFVLESIKISWELIVYFSMKIKNSDHRGALCIQSCQIFSRVSMFYFSVYLCLIVSKT